jgi:hypothetical protein
MHGQLYAKSSEGELSLGLLTGCIVEDCFSERNISASFINAS